MALEWSESGNHGDRWVKGQVSTSNLNPYQIAIEATYGANYTGDIAIDDTFITIDGLCNGKQCYNLLLSFPSLEIRYSHVIILC